MRVLSRTLLVLILIFYQNDLTAEPLTLSQCLQRAFKVNRLLQMADIDFRIAEAQLGASRAQRYPSINAMANYTRVGKVTSFTIPMGTMERTFQFGTPNRINADVRLQWPVFAWGRIRSSIEMARYGIDLRATQRKQQQIMVTDQVIRAYYALLFNQKVISVHQANVERAQQHLRTALHRFRSGDVSHLDTLRAQSQLENAKSMLAEAELNLAKSRVFLAQLLEMEPQSLSVGGDLVVAEINLDEKQIIDKAMNLRPELTSLAIQQKLAEENIRISKTMNKPNLSLFTSYNVQNGFDPMNPDKFVDNWNVGIQLNVPIFDGFATSFNTQQTKLQMEKIGLQQRELRQAIVTQAKTALIGLQQSEAKLSAQAVGISLARAALQTAEKRYREGLSSSLEVLDAQQALAQAEAAELQWRFNYIMAKIELCSVMGDYSLFATN